MTSYYNKLKSLYDKLEVFEPPLTCSCEVTHIYSKRVSGHQAIKVLNCLNDNYLSIRNQILLMDPRSSMARTYALVLQIGRKNEVNISRDLGVFMTDEKNFDKRKTNMDKRN